MNHKRIMIAGTNSGCGKTTITCAIIKALKIQGNDVVSFKTGPDYVDPMFHNVILKNKCRNLDLFFHDENTINHLINKNTKINDIAIIEGVMGYYDGLGGISSKASSYELAYLTKTPTILIVDGSGVSVSLNAMIKGFLEYKENTIIGIIINNISPMFYQTIKPIIEKECEIEVLGYLEFDEKLKLNHRHLGLLMPNEIADIEDKMDILANKASISINLKRIVEIASNVEILNEDYKYPEPCKTVKIALAYDDVFCFHYLDNFELLEKLGADLVYFSPLNDDKLPDDIDGLIIGGGYPELFIEQLSNNKTMHKSIKNAIANNMPIFVQGSGFVYLGSDLVVNNESYPLLDIIKMQSVFTNKLQPFGYIINEAMNDNMLMKKGEKIAAHEFGYTTTNCTYNALIATKPIGNKTWKTGYQKENIFAGFSQYHFYSNPNMIKNYLEKCLVYQKKRGVK